MNHTINLSLLLTLLLFASSCSQKPEKKVADNPAIQQEEQVTTVGMSSEIMERGSEIYKKRCFACHLTEGVGVKGVYPPLTDNSTVTGEKQALIGILLHGKSGEIEVNGIKYNQVMAPQNALSDKDIADVLTYIRNSFGNKADAIAVAEVKFMRKKK